MDSRRVKSCSLLCFVMCGCAGTLDEGYFEAEDDRVNAAAAEASDRWEDASIASQADAAAQNPNWASDAGQATAQPPDAGATWEPEDELSYDAGTNGGEETDWDAGLGSTEPDTEVSETEPEPEPEVDDPGCDFPALMAQRCGNSGCHGAFGSAAGLDLVSDGIAQRLSSVSGSGACGDFAMIDSSSPEQSLLYVKVTDQACGIRMPIGGTLSDSEQQCILDWIAGL